MTYGDLIVYIIENELINEEVFKDGKLAGFMNIQEAAVKFDTGVATIAAWMETGMLDFVNFNGCILIPETAHIKERVTYEQNSVCISNVGSDSNFNVSCKSKI